MPRSNQTKFLLAQSLQELMQKTPLEKISVNDIVEQAEVGRNTFYYHFEDKYDLVNWYFQAGATRFLLQRATYGTWQEILYTLEDYLRENKTFYTNAFAYNGQNSLQEYIFNFLCELYYQRLSENAPDLNEIKLNFCSRFLAGALMGVLVPWVNSGMKQRLDNQLFSDKHYNEKQLFLTMAQSMFDLPGSADGQ